jgi:hypothetical protein
MAFPRHFPLLSLLTWLLVYFFFAAFANHVPQHTEEVRYDLNNLDL